MLPVEYTFIVLGLIDVLASNTSTYCCLQDPVPADCAISPRCFEALMERTGVPLQGWVYCPWRFVPVHVAMIALVLLAAIPCRAVRSRNAPN
jgi:hypothetical protein